MSKDSSFKILDLPSSVAGQSTSFANFNFEDEYLDEQQQIKKRQYHVYFSRDEVCEVAKSEIREQVDILAESKDENFGAEGWKQEKVKIVDNNNSSPTSFIKVARRLVEEKKVRLSNLCKLGLRLMVPKRERKDEEFKIAVSEVSPPAAQAAPQLNPLEAQRILKKKELSKQIFSREARDDMPSSTISHAAVMRNGAVSRSHFIKKSVEDAAPEIAAPHLPTPQTLIGGFAKHLNPLRSSDGSAVAFCQVSEIDNIDGSKDVHVAFVVPDNKPPLFPNTQFIHIKGTGTSAENPLLYIKVKYLRGNGRLFISEKLFASKNGNYEEYKPQLNSTQTNFLRNMRVTAAVQRVAAIQVEKVVVQAPEVNAQAEREVQQEVKREREEEKVPEDNSQAFVAGGAEVVPPVQKKQYTEERQRSIEAANARTVAARVKVEEARKKLETLKTQRAAKAQRAAELQELEQKEEEVEEVISSEKVESLVEVIPEYRKQLFLANKSNSHFAEIDQIITALRNIRDIDDVADDVALEERTLEISNTIKQSFQKLLEIVQQEEGIKALKIFLEDEDFKKAFLSSLPRYSDYIRLSKQDNPNFSQYEQNYYETVTAINDIVGELKKQSPLKSKLNFRKKPLTEEDVYDVWIMLMGGVMPSLGDKTDAAGIIVTLRDVGPTKKPNYAFKVGKKDYDSLENALKRVNKLIDSPLSIELSSKGPFPQKSALLNKAARKNKAGIQFEEEVAVRTDHTVGIKLENEHLYGESDDEEEVKAEIQESKKQVSSSFLHDLKFSVQKVVNNGDKKSDKKFLIEGGSAVDENTLKKEFIPGTIISQKAHARSPFGHSISVLKADNRANQVDLETIEIGTTPNGVEGGNVQSSNMLSFESLGDFTILSPEISEDQYDKVSAIIKRSGEFLTEMVGMTYSVKKGIAGFGRSLLPSKIRDNTASDITYTIVKAMAYEAIKKPQYASATCSQLSFLSYQVALFEDAAGPDMVSSLKQRFQQFYREVEAMPLPKPKLIRNYSKTNEEREEEIRKEEFFKKFDEYFYGNKEKETKGSEADLVKIMRKMPERFKVRASEITPSTLIEVLSSGENQSKTQLLTANAIREKDKADRKQPSFEDAVDQIELARGKDKQKNQLPADKECKVVRDNLQEFITEFSKCTTNADYAQFLKDNLALLNSINPDERPLILNRFIEERNVEAVKAIIEFHKNDRDLQLISTDPESSFYSELYVPPVGRPQVNKSPLYLAAFIKDDAKSAEILTMLLEVEKALIDNPKFEYDDLLFEADNNGNYLAAKVLADAGVKRHEKLQREFLHLSEEVTEKDLVKIIEDNAFLACTYDMLDVAARFGYKTLVSKILERSGDELNEYPWLIFPLLKYNTTSLQDENKSAYDNFNEILKILLNHSKESGKSREHLELVENNQQQIFIEIAIKNQNWKAARSLLDIGATIPSSEKLRELLQLTKDSKPPKEIAELKKYAKQKSKQLEEERKQKAQELEEIIKEQEERKKASEIQLDNSEVIIDHEETEEEEKKKINDFIEKENKEKAILERLGGEAFIEACESGKKMEELQGKSLEEVRDAYYAITYAVTHEKLKGKFASEISTLLGNKMLEANELKKAQNPEILKQEPKSPTVRTLDFSDESDEFPSLLQLSPLQLFENESESPIITESPSASPDEKKSSDSKQDSSEGDSPELSPIRLSPQLSSTDENITPPLQPLSPQLQNSSSAPLPLLQEESKEEINVPNENASLDEILDFLNNTMAALNAKLIEADEIRDPDKATQTRRKREILNSPIVKALENAIQYCLENVRTATASKEGVEKLFNSYFSDISESDEKLKKLNVFSNEQFKSRKLAPIVNDIVTQINIGLPQKLEELKYKIHLLLIGGTSALKGMIEQYIKYEQIESVTLKDFNGLLSAAEDMGLLDLPNEADNNKSLLDYAIQYSGDQTSFNQTFPRALSIINRGSLQKSHQVIFTACNIPDNHPRKEWVKYLLEREEVANSVMGFSDQYRLSPIHILALHGDSDDIRSLLQKHPDLVNVKMQDKPGSTALHILAKDRKVDVARTLMEEFGASILADEVGNTPFHESAVVSKAGNMIGFLANHAQNKSIINHQNTKGKTALHLAAERGHIGNYNALIAAGADDSLTTSEGLRASEILEARKQEWHEKSNGLKAKLGSIASEAMARDVNNGITQFERICLADCPELFIRMFSEEIATNQYLRLTKGADGKLQSYQFEDSANFSKERTSFVELLSNQVGSALLFAVSNAEFSIDPQILQGFASQNKVLFDAVINKQLRNQKMPLENAVINGHVALARFFVNNGANILHEGRQREDMNIIYTAVNNGASREMLEFLMQNVEQALKPKPEEKAANKSKKIVEDKSKEKLADMLNALSVQGDSALHTAVKKGQADNVELLLKNGADIFLKDGDDMTIFDIAYNAKDKKVISKIVKFLLENKQFGYTGEGQSNLQVLDSLNNIVLTEDKVGEGEEKKISESDIVRYETILLQCLTYFQELEKNKPAKLKAAPEEQKKRRQGRTSLVGFITRRNGDQASESNNSSPSPEENKSPRVVIHAEGRGSIIKGLFGTRSSITSSTNSPVPTPRGNSSNGDSIDSSSSSRDSSTSSRFSLPGLRKKPKNAAGVESSLSSHLEETQDKPPTAYEDEQVESLSRFLSSSIPPEGLALKVINPDSISEEENKHSENSSPDSTPPISSTPSPSPDSSPPLSPSPSPLSPLSRRESGTPSPLSPAARQASLGKKNNGTNPLDLSSTSDGSSEVKGPSFLEQQRAYKATLKSIDQTGDINLVNDEGNNTALHLAVLAGSFTDVDRLLKAGANIDAQNTNSLTALQIAKANISITEVFPEPTNEAEKRAARARQNQVQENQDIFSYLLNAYWESMKNNISDTKRFIDLYVQHENIPEFRKKCIEGLRFIFSEWALEISEGNKLEFSQIELIKNLNQADPKLFEDLIENDGVFTHENYQTLLVACGFVTENKEEKDVVVEVPVVAQIENEKEKVEVEKDPNVTSSNAGENKNLRRKVVAKLVPFTRAVNQALDKSEAVGAKFDAFGQKALGKVEEAGKDVRKVLGAETKQDKEDEQIEIMNAKMRAIWACLGDSIVNDNYNFQIIGSLDDACDKKNVGSFNRVLGDTIFTPTAFRKAADDYQKYQQQPSSTQELTESKEPKGLYDPVKGLSDVDDATVMQAQEAALSNFISSQNNNISKQDQNGDNLLHHLARQNNSQLITYLMGQSLISNENINVQNNLGETPLHLAIQSGSIVNVMKLLRVDGIDVDIKNSAGKSVLEIAQNSLNKDISGLFEKHYITKLKNFERDMINEIGARSLKEMLWYINIDKKDCIIPESKELEQDNPQQILKQLIARFSDNTSRYLNFNNPDRARCEIRMNVFARAINKILKANSAKLDDKDLDDLKNIVTLLNKACKEETVEKLIQPFGNIKAKILDILSENQTEKADALRLSLRDTEEFFVKTIQEKEQKTQDQESKQLLDDVENALNQKDKYEIIFQNAEIFKPNNIDAVDDFLLLSNRAKDRTKFQKLLTGMVDGVKNKKTISGKITLLMESNDDPKVKSAKIKMLLQHLTSIKEVMDINQHNDETRQLVLSLNDAIARLNQANSELQSENKQNVPTVSNPVELTPAQKAKLEFRSILQYVNSHTDSRKNTKFNALLDGMFDTTKTELGTRGLKITKVPGRINSLLVDFDKLNDAQKAEFIMMVEEIKTGLTSIKDRHLLYPNEVESASHQAFLARLEKATKELDQVKSKMQASALERDLKNALDQKNWQEIVHLANLGSNQEQKDSDVNNGDAKSTFKFLTSKFLDNASGYLVSGEKENKEFQIKMLAFSETINAMIENKLIGADDEREMITAIEARLAQWKGDFKNIKDAKKAEKFKAAFDEIMLQIHKICKIAPAQEEVEKKEVEHTVSKLGKFTAKIISKRSTVKPSKEQQSLEELSESREKLKSSLKESEAEFGEAVDEMNKILLTKAKEKGQELLAKSETKKEEDAKAHRVAVEVSLGKAEENGNVSFELVFEYSKKTSPLTGEERSKLIQILQQMFTAESFVEGAWEGVKGAVGASQKPVLDKVDQIFKKDDQLRKDKIEMLLEKLQAISTKEEGFENQAKIKSGGGILSQFKAEIPKSSAEIMGPKLKEILGSAIQVLEKARIEIEGVDKKSAQTPKSRGRTPSPTARIRKGNRKLEGEKTHGRGDDE